MNAKLNLLIKLFVLLTVALVFVEVAVSQVKSDPPISLNQQSAGGFQITVSAQQGIVHTTDPVVLLVTITNITSTRLHYDEGEPEQDFNVIVHDGKGKSMPLTRHGQDVVKLQKSVRDSLANVRSGSIVVHPLPSGKTAKYKILVNAMYDMTVGEDYFITVKRNFSSSNEEHVSVSNTIKITNLGEDRIR